MNLAYKNEKPLFVILFTISLVCWIGAALVTKGAIFLALPVVFFIYLFVQSGMICHFKGTGALISTDQFPDLDEQVKKCAGKLGLKKTPTAYLMNGDGLLNAFATQFLRRHFIVLLSDIADALEDNPDALNFYIGHELGHIQKKHLLWSVFLTPASVLPLLGAAYSRAREYTCDLHGAHCCETPASAQQALAALGVGARRWRSVNLAKYSQQAANTREFWMSFHELISSYPWLTKRLARLTTDPANKRIPRRNMFAYLPAILVPRLSFATLVVLYVAGVMAAITLPSENANFEDLQMPSPIPSETYDAMPSPQPDAQPDMQPDMPTDMPPDVQPSETPPQQPAP